LLKNRKAKGLKRAQDCPKGPKMNRKIKWKKRKGKMAQEGARGPKIAQEGPRGPKRAQEGPR